MNRRIAALAIAAAALLGLTACSMIPGLGTESQVSPAPSSETGGDDAGGDDGQSVTEACALIEGAITSATEGYESATDGDLATVVEAMRAAAADLTALGSEVTNDEVAALLPGIQDLYANTADVMETVAGGDLSKLDEMNELGASMQETMQQYQALCLTS